MRVFRNTTFWIALACCGTSLISAVAAEQKTWQVAVLKDVMVPMRDGVELATDIYLPASESGQPAAQKFPVVLQRTPYNKEPNFYKGAATFFARHGYVSVIQDCRGRFNSNGVFHPLVDEPEDGYDTIEWLARHPNSNGKVGTYGVSYMAWVQFQAATQRPPSLVTMIPMEGPINGYHYSQRYGGALHLGLLQWILAVATSSQEARKDPAIAEAINPMRTGQGFLDWAARIPWRRGQTPLSLAPQYEDSAFKLYFENYDYNDFWKQPGLGMDEYFESYPEIPILWVVGWFDWYPKTISDGYQKMVKMGRENQYLLIGPWTHNNFDTIQGDVSFGNKGEGVDTYDDFFQMELEWFNKWMKDDESVDLGARAKIFVMGGGDGARLPDGRLNHGGEWHDTDAWPPRGAESRKFFLHSDGSLSGEPPRQSGSSTTYTYDPKNTVSSNGRCIIAYGPALETGFKGMGPRDQIELETLPGHGVPGMPITSRPDVVVFQTPPLKEDVRITGDARVVLWVSSDAPDTDFYVKLVDVYPSTADYPNGYGFPASEGILRARYRDSFEDPTLMEPGQVYRLEIPLEPLANLFKANHRIQIYITSSNFPNFDINRNTGDPDDRRWRVANNTIHHDSGRASFLELSVYP